MRKQDIEMPWPEPSGPGSVYKTNGPASSVVFDLLDVTFEVAPAFDEKGRPLDGLHSGRGRFRTRCVSCDLTIHPATTGPGSNIRSHLRSAHPVAVGGGQ